MRKKVVLMVLLLMLLLVCGGCGDSLQDKAEKGMLPYEDLGYLVVADKDTHILYYENGDGAMCPYYSTNGKLCKYEDGHIIEIGE